jgi:hypothetical protein
MQELKSIIGKSRLVIPKQTPNVAYCINKINPNLFIQNENKTVFSNGTVGIPCSEWM